MRRAIFARHAESEYSAKGLLNGDVRVPVGLTEQGIREASALGETLNREQLDLCVTSAFRRAAETADLALAGRDVPRVVDPRLNDPLYGRFEGADIEGFRAWASTAPSSERAEPGGESRHEVVTRYVRAFRDLLAREEDAVLVVCHSLPVSYVLGARDGRTPGARMPIAGHATPYPFTAEELEAATTLLERWLASPTW